MWRAGHQERALLLLMVWLTRADASPLGRVFLLELESFSKGGQEDGFEAAAQACMAQGARVASGADLHHAVLECAFSACSRAWLSGPSVGSTVCSGVPGHLRPVDVQLENSTANTESLGVFCVKDSDAPCGQPPSFPHSHLQGKTGLDLGDELLYACDPGHKLPNGETAFSLLCDSCGEWYGLVQHCVKDDPEGHIDYEDKFTDDHLLENSEEHHHISLTSGGTQSTQREEEKKSTPEPVLERTALSDEKNDEDSTISATEPPVSQLSQKHMFWFPSEAFQEEKGHVGITTDSFKNPTEDESVKTADSQSDPDVITDEHLTDPPTEEPSSPNVEATDDSWLDGYPVGQEEDKAGGGSTGEAGPEHEAETETGQSEVEVFEDAASKKPVEEETGGLIGSPDEEDSIHIKGDEEQLTRLEEESVGIHEDTTEGITKDGEVHTPEKTALEFDGVTESPNGLGVKTTTIIMKITPSPGDIALNKRPMVYTPASAPENVSTSQEGLDNTSTTSGMVHLDEITSIPTAVIKDPWEAIDDHLMEHIPGYVPTDTPENQSMMEQGGDHSLDQQERDLVGGCVEDPCHGAGHGPMIAAIIVGVVAALAGVVLGVWCYKKRQQKSSHYQLNGTNRQTQSIELQQTV
ncbi:sushi domain-containing protein 5 [Danio rerio]|uniref:Sushi domain-containing 5 n=1 Tax=Danio rerio TaxID=7955 RepID=A0A8M3ASV6_DANRE|nr:sushi domain-containing protein 5 [Danio rerio]XP_009292705.1 sushi domain-containing protein 5 [Danio rerio]|eukprot:XP_005159810.1 sushi domain-containing protein 5 [Danio rerio]